MNKNRRIYFAGSIRGGSQDASLYQAMIGELQAYGTVLTEHIGKEDISLKYSDREIHDLDLGWLKSSDILIAEVSTPSLGVGYEIGRAIGWGIPSYCFFRDQGKKLSAMLSGNPNLTVFAYSDLSEFRALIEKLFAEGLPKR